MAKEMLPIAFHSPPMDQVKDDVQARQCASDVLSAEQATIQVIEFAQKLSVKVSSSLVAEDLPIMLYHLAVLAKREPFWPSSRHA